MNFRELKKRIKKNEGFSLKPYKDQLGYLTIGYGHLILPDEVKLLKTKTSKAQLNAIFNQDFERAVRDYKRLIKQKNQNTQNIKWKTEYTRILQKQRLNINIPRSHVNQHHFTYSKKNRKTNKGDVWRRMIQ